MWPGCVYRRVADGVECRTDGEILPGIEKCSGHS